MLCLIIQLTVKSSSDIESVKSLLMDAGRLSRSEPGCMRFDVYQSKSEPTRFTLCEHWESQEAIDRHREAQAYTTIYKPQVLPLVERVAHPSELLQ